MNAPELPNTPCKQCTRPSDHSLASNCKLRHQVRCHIQERIRAGYFFLLVTEAAADRVPFILAFIPNHVLIAVAFEVDHEVAFFHLVQLDVHEDPHSMDDFVRWFFR